MKRILSISLSLLFVAITLASCKKEKKEKDSTLKTEKTYLIRTVWHTTAEQYKYTDANGTVIHTSATPAGSRYSFKEDGSLVFTNKANVVTNGSYKLYKDGDKKYLDIILDGQTNTYVLNGIDVTSMTWNLVKANQVYTINGVEHEAAKLEIVYTFACGCYDK